MKSTALKIFSSTILAGAIALPVQAESLDDLTFFSNKKSTFGLEEKKTIGDHFKVDESNKSISFGYLRFIPLSQHAPQVLGNSNSTVIQGVIMNSQEKYSFGAQAQYDVHENFGLQMNVAYSQWALRVSNSTVNSRDIVAAQWNQLASGGLNPYDIPNRSVRLIDYNNQKFMLGFNLVAHSSFQHNLLAPYVGIGPELMIDMYGVLNNGTGNNANFLSSELSSLLNYTNQNLTFNDAIVSKLAVSGFLGFNLNWSKYVTNFCQIGVKHIAAYLPTQNTSGLVLANGEIRDMINFQGGFNIRF